MAVAVDYTFYTYGDVGTMWGMLNSVVMIMGSSPYQTMIRLMLAFGAILMSLYMMGLSTHAHRGWRWLITVALVSSILFGPKATVAVEDVTGNDAPQVVANVPEALALLFGTKSAIGHSLTKIAETGFQTISGEAVVVGGNNPTNFILPAELTYLEHGMMFGARAITASRSAGFIDPQIKTDVVNYIKDCVLPSIGPLISIDTLQRTSALWAEMAHTNNALFAAYWDVNSASYVYDTCPNVYTVLDARVGTGVEGAIGRLGAALFPQASSPNNAKALAQAGILAAYSKAGIADTSATANSIVLQNAMINALSDASGAMAIQNNNASAVLQAFAKEQGATQTNASLITQGETVGAAMPVVKNLLDMIMIASFPVIAMLLIATEGEMLKSLGVKYILAMVWTELWPFMYAVISFIGNNYSARRVAAMSFMPDANGGSFNVPLSVLNADAIYSGSVSDLGMVGWAMGIVPFIAAAIVFGMDRLASAVNNSGIAASSGATAGQAAVGNAQGGIVNFDKYDAGLKKTDAFMTTAESVRGAIYGDARAAGDPSQQRWDTRIGSSAVKLSDVASFGESWAQQSKNADTLAHSNIAAASSTVRSAFNDTLAYLKSRGDTKAVEQLLSSQHTDNYGLTSDQMSGVTERLARDLGITVTDANSREMVSVMATALEARASTPGSAVLPMSASATLSHRLQQAGSHANQEQIRNALQRATDVAETLRTGNTAQAVDTATKGDSFKSGDQSGKELTTKVDGQLSKGKDYMRKADDAFRNSREYAELASKTKLMSKGMEFNWTTEFNSYVASQKIDPRTVSSENAGALVASFLHSRTRIGRNDNGEFLSLNVFTDVMTPVQVGGGTVTNAGEFGGGALKTTFDERLNKGGLGKETAIPKNAPDANNVISAANAAQGTVRATANKAGVPTGDLSAPEKLKSLEGTEGMTPEEIKAAGAKLQGKASSRKEGVGSEVGDQMNRGMKAYETASWDKLPEASTDVPVLPGQPKPAQPSKTESAADRIPK